MVFSGRINKKQIALIHNEFVCFILLSSFDHDIQRDRWKIGENRSSLMEDLENARKLKNKKDILLLAYSPSFYTVYLASIDHSIIGNFFIVILIVNVLNQYSVVCQTYETCVPR